MFSQADGERFLWKSIVNRPNPDYLIVSIDPPRQPKHFGTRHNGASLRFFFLVAPSLLRRVALRSENPHSSTARNFVDMSADAAQVLPIPCCQRSHEHPAKPAAARTAAIRDSMPECA